MYTHICTCKKNYHACYKHSFLHFVGCSCIFHHWRLGRFQLFLHQSWIWSHFSKTYPYRGSRKPIWCKKIKIFQILYCWVLQYDEPDLYIEFQHKFGVFLLQFNTIARDQSNPERTATAYVVIDILRDTSPPVFIQEPYVVTNLPETRAVGTSVYTVTARDNDLKVKQWFLKKIFDWNCLGMSRKFQIVLYLTCTRIKPHYFLRILWNQTIYRDTDIPS